MFKKFITLFAIIIFNCNSFAQLTNEIVLNLSSDLIDEVNYFTNPVKIMSTQTIFISGVFSSASYVRITPQGNNSILIKPLTTANRSILDPNGDGTTTIIKIKPLSGGGGQPPTTITIYPNPVQTDLTYSITNSLVSSYEIYNMSGVLMVTQLTTPSNTGLINVSNLTNGIYILKLDVTNGQQISIQFNKI